LPSSRLYALRKGKHLCVNLGSGHELYEGWLSLDLQTSFKEALAWDLRRSLPFSDGSVARVYSSHLLEHLDFSSDAPRLLREILRVLEVGGRVRIVVPDVARWLEAYVHKDDAEWNALGLSQLPACFPTWMAAVNHVFHQNGEHQFG
jgi:predicted SAM-dependent methyltransferase